MKQKLTPRWLIIKLTGLLFAAYSAYNVFVIIRSQSILTSQGKFISAVVALAFGVLAVFAWTTEVKDPRFRLARRIAFLLDLLLISLLKLRMIGQTMSYLDLSKIHTVLYDCAYFATLAALLILLIYYLIIRKNFLLYLRPAVFLPLLAMLLFLCSFVLEAILLFVYNVGSEASPLRIIVSRPLFYLGFIGLSAYFLFLPKPIDGAVRRNRKKK